LKDLKGMRRSDDITKAPEIGADNGFKVKNSPGFGFETEPSGGALSRTGSQRNTGVEAKAQVGSVDLVMVAKASLRASERPFRVSGSGRMQVLKTRF